jgi:tRNA pseudouridine38-40 synthase
MRAGFDARRSAGARRYRYVVGTDDASRSPFRRPYEWPLARDVDRSRLDAAAALLLGEHAFHGLAAAGAATTHYRCRVVHSEWAPRTDGEGVVYTIEANRFLHRMVRFLVGTMIDIGLGRRPLSDLATLLVAPDNRDASPPAPPHGLYLTTVRYPADLYCNGTAP